MSSPRSDSDEFYESIDRILSSSGSSTSASDDDDIHRRPHIRFPPASAASIDVWLAAPAPVEERRRLLLHQMGLAADPALARRLDATAPRRRRSMTELPRSASFDGVYSHTDPAAIARSRSDGAVDTKQPPPAKPPLVGRSLPPSRGSIDLDHDDEVRRCTIKSLDTGREFIVKEIHVDGTCEHLREVGTGRQLTIEEFEMCVGRSPIVQELMRRQTVQDSDNGVSPRGPSPSVKKNGWLRSIKNAVGGARERRSSDERDTSSEKGGRRSSSATDDSQDGADCPHRTKVRHYGKSHKELTSLYLSQEIPAHNGAIWSIKFSLDGRHLASAGEDCVIHVWQVVEQDRKGELLVAEENGSRGSRSQELTSAFVEGNHSEKRRSKLSGGRKSMSSDQLMVPEHVFGLSEKPVCTFRGHVDDVLDLSWSKSQYLLSSSMDKTVRLWHMSSKSCLKTFSHSDYVTCIQFNPVDDRFFISGSLDEKVRIWSIPDRQVVDWNDLHEMVTAVCYTPDGQGALVGSHKGRCHLYHTSDNKLHQKSQIDLQNKKRKSSSKKITGFQFAPGSSSELLITAADSRIRVVDGATLVQKFKGFRNTSSQIAASLSANGKYVISASEDSHVYVWRHDVDSRPGRSKGAVTTTQSYEYFHCQNVTVALPWPGTSTPVLEAHSTRQNLLDGVSNSNPWAHSIGNGHSTRQNLLDGVSNSNPWAHSIGNGHNLNLDCKEQGDIIGHYSDRVSATWPEEKLTADNYSTQSTVGGTPGQSRSAWGMVIVTAGRGGEIRTFQNFGIPVRT